MNNKIMNNNNKIKRTIHNKANIYSKIIDNWKNIVGENLFSACFPKSFKSFNNSEIKRLNIMVKRGHEVDVEYSKKTIISKINSFVGYEFINKIKIITFEEENEKMVKKKIFEENNSKFVSKISKIRNDKIKNSLVELNKFFKKK